MKTVWIKGIEDEDAKKEVKSLFIQSKRIRDILSLILKEKIASNDNERTSKGGYDSPNWAYLQADSAGYQRAMKEILSVLEN